MTAFSRQLRGEVTYRANPEGGLTARLSFPLNEAEPVPPAEPGWAPTRATG
jgi:hypothetical protein